MKKVILPQPLLILIGGESATGKTTLARRLATEYSLPLLVRDDIKEALFDTLGVRDRDWSQKMGVVSYAVLYRLSERFLDLNISHILESNFHSEASAPHVQKLITEHACRVLYVHLTAKSAVLARRAVKRLDRRHPGHNDQVVIEERKKLRKKGQKSSSELPMNISAELLQVDTTNFSEAKTKRILKRIEVLLKITLCDT